MPKERKSWAEQALTARTGREVPDLLRELYIDKRHSQQEIADALGVSRSQISTWLGEYGISRDERPPVEVTAA